MVGPNSQAVLLLNESLSNESVKAKILNRIKTN